MWSAGCIFAGLFFVIDKQRFKIVCTAKYIYAKILSWFILFPCPIQSWQMLEGLYSLGTMWTTSWKESSDIFFWHHLYTIVVCWSRTIDLLFQQWFMKVAITKSFSLTSWYIVGYTNWRTVADNDKTPRLQGKLLMSNCVIPTVCRVYTVFYCCFFSLNYSYLPSFSPCSHIPCIQPPPHWWMWSPNSVAQDGIYSRYFDLPTFRFFRNLHHQQCVVFQICMHPLMYLNINISTYVVHKMFFFQSFITVCATTANYC